MPTKTIPSASSWSRRQVLAAAAAVSGGVLVSPRLYAEAGAREVRLKASQTEVAVVGNGYPNTKVWSYNGVVPGPEIRVKQGERLKVIVENGLDEDTTVHWHGVRVPNRMDGVPHVTQQPIKPGESFTYEFEARDAGTYWYHPHQRSFEQVARGLAGALIVEEREPIGVDRDITWMLSDWRLSAKAELTDDFGNLHDVSHAGRLGNTVTINGRIPNSFDVRAGERLRLRLINSANARIFGLRFGGHEPLIIAIDGQPVTPHPPAESRVVLGPGMRIDLLLEMRGQPDERHRVDDIFYPGQEYRLIDIVYAATGAVPRTQNAAPRLIPNPLADPDLGSAARHEVILGGGMMGGMVSAMVDGEAMDMRGMMRRGLAWTLNGVAATGHVHEPMAVLQRGSSNILAMENQTAWWHPMHLHGHVFRVLSRNGVPSVHREWQDTVLLAPREKVEVAFVADNPGDWMFHCHVLEHQSGGMMGIIRVQ